MKTTIKDLYAGRPDAKDEINYDGLDEFIKTFVVPSNFDIERLVDKNDCFITGYKGTGKTALLFIWMIIFVIKIVLLAPHSFFLKKNLLMPKNRIRIYVA